MNILAAIQDEHLFQPFLGDDLTSWKAWSIALRALYGLPIKSERGKELVKQCTGRNADELPEEGFRTALFLVGRRSGKSRIAAVVGAYESLFGGHELRLAKGELGLLPIISPTRFQSGICWRYLAALFDTPLLKAEVEDTKESDKSITLRSGLEIRVLVDDFRTIRGPTIVCAIVDEICHLGLDSESKVKSDTELIRALKPALLTTGGKLIGISSKYAKRGWAFKTWSKQHGSNRGVSPNFVEKWSTLIWDSPSIVMNPTLSAEEIAAAYAEDPTAAASELGGAWREDVSAFIERSLIESLVAKGTKELLPRNSIRYSAFVDLSGGRNDAASLAIGHVENRKVTLDLLRVWPAPHNPYSIVGLVADELKRFNLRSIVGDNFAASFVSDSFKSHGINYTKSEMPKSALYLEFLPRLCSREIELLDLEVLVDQISGLERRTRSGGRDIVDHPNGGQDDAANAVAGMAAHVTKSKIRIGGYRS